MMTPQKPLPTSFIEEVIDTFSGAANYSNSTLILARIASKLSTEVVQFMTEQLDEELTEVVTEIARKKTGKPVEIAAIDHRPYRKLLNSHSLRGSKNFLGPITTDEDRKNALCRIRHIASDTGQFKGMSRLGIDEQTVRAIAVRKEIEKFMRVLDNDEWTASMNISRRNLLEITVDDYEVESNKSDDSALLTSLKHKYISTGGKHAVNLLGRYKRRIPVRTGY